MSLVNLPMTAISLAASSLHTLNSSYEARSGSAGQNAHFLEIQRSISFSCPALHLVLIFTMTSAMYLMFELMSSSRKLVKNLMNLATSSSVNASSFSLERRLSISWRLRPSHERREPVAVLPAAVLFHHVSNSSALIFAPTPARAICCI